MKKALMTAAALVLSAGVALAQSDTKGAGTKEGKETKEAHLGIAVANVPASLYSHLPETLAKGEGVLVAQVAKDSPAAKAGLKAHDILLTYDNQKLFSPEQLVKMVRADKPGHEVALSYLRAGKVMNTKAKLGEAEPAQETPHAYQVIPREDRGNQAKTGGGNSGFWESFDELRLTRTDDKHWHAIIDYRNKDGKKEEKSFKGTREEIRKAIEAEKDLPANERTHLLNALNMRVPSFEFYFPPAEFWDHQ